MVYNISALVASAARQITEGLENLSSAASVASVTGPRLNNKNNGGRVSSVLRISDPQLGITKASNA